MSEMPPSPIRRPTPPPPPPQPIVIRRQGGSLFARLLFLLLLVSIVANVGMYLSYREYFTTGTEPIEKFQSGDRLAVDKIAVINVSGTIMPPFTERILRAIRHARKDENVRGIILSVDSPGGLVADSHQIYHRLKQLAEEKPIFVVMKRIAASGGYYIAMGAGTGTKIFAEPTTWTGSIGVIIPHYDLSGLAEKWNVKSEPLKTGEFKDSLSPFRPLTKRDRAVWDAILDDAFQKFVAVIAENRPKLDAAAVKKLATGQVYTADQALANGLVDQLGYEDDAIGELKKKLGLAEVRVVRYEFRPALIDLLTASVEANQPETRWRAMMESTVPRAMYYCSWAPGLPNW